MRFVEGGRTLWLTEEGIWRHRWRVDWRVFVTHDFQPRICWWRFRDQLQAEQWYRLFETDQQPRIEWEREGRLHRLVLDESTNERNTR